MVPSPGPGGHGMGAERPNMCGDSGLAAHVRSLRSHAMTSGTWTRHHERSGEYDVIDLGFNYRMDEAHAALGSALLASLPEQNERRRSATDRYHEGLDGLA